MLYRAHLQLFLLVVLLTAAAALGQPSAPKGPVTKIEVFVALETAKEQSGDLVAKTNSELTAAIADRGVDFVLTPEEEWQLQMRDGSEDLLRAIRNAVDPKEREARINADRQQRLYNEFAAGYNANDLSSRRAALNAAREFVSLYPNDPNVAEIVTFMQRNLPRLEQQVSMMEQREAAMERARSEAAARQMQIEQMRQERERQGRGSSEEAASRDQNARRDRNSQVNGPETRVEPPQPRQPSDPVARPRFPIVRRP